ncbi:MAG: hypothetical protein ACK5JT_04960 [Hyphomicrobiaceae bacterium]
MRATQIQEHARKLFDSLGDKALAAAAQNAVQHEKHRDSKSARDWRRIEAALRHIRGPHAS